MNVRADLWGHDFVTALIGRSGAAGPDRRLRCGLGWVARLDRFFASTTCHCFGVPEEDVRVDTQPAFGTACLKAAKQWHVQPRDRCFHESVGCVKSSERTVIGNARRQLVRSEDSTHPTCSTRGFDPTNAGLGSICGSRYHAGAFRRRHAPDVFHPGSANP